MNNVTFETAMLLKEAGFPEPTKFSLGQFWFIRVTKRTDYEKILVVPSFDPDIECRLSGITSDRWTPIQDDIFAPTSTDILQQLTAFLFFDGRQWVVMEIGSNKILGFHEEPAEACAAAWLSVNEKKQE